MSTTNGRSGRSGSVFEVKLNQSAFDNSRFNQEDKTFKIIEKRVGLTTGTQFFYQYDQLLFKGDAPADSAVQNSLTEEIPLQCRGRASCSWGASVGREDLHSVPLTVSVQGSKKYVSLGLFPKLWAGGGQKCKSAFSKIHIFSAMS